MALKLGRIEIPAVAALYFDCVEAQDWHVDDSRLRELADRLIAMFKKMRNPRRRVRRWTSNGFSGYPVVGRVNRFNVARCGPGGQGPTDPN